MFEEDLEYSKEQRKKLKKFYQSKAFEGRCVFINNQKILSGELQKKGVDTIMQTSDNDEVYIEEKIVRWKGKKYDALTLETISCTCEGMEKDGWMKYCQADWLAYGMEQENNTIILYMIPFPKLKKWFWENVDKV